MLQQTQIKTVIPYYRRWLRAFPTVQAFARAPLDRVLKLWEGLGYYSRARNLHQAAKIIVERFEGEIPNDPEELMKLPGIGRYTAGAVSSIAFQKAVPLVDGNVARVLARVFNLREDISKPKTHEKLYELANTLLFRKEPGTFNQALMELGSLICIPEMPKCHLCPVANDCIAFRRGSAWRLPIRSGKTEVKKIDMVIGVICKNGKLLVRRRPARGIWGGLWEIPGTIHTKAQTPEEALKQELRAGLGLQVKIEKKLPLLEHRFTHRKAQIQPFVCSVRKPSNRQAFGADWRWADPSQLKTLSFPRPHQKIIKDHF